MTCLSSHISIDILNLNPESKNRITTEKLNDESGARFEKSNDSMMSKNQMIFCHVC